MWLLILQLWIRHAGSCGNDAAASPRTRKTLSWSETRLTLKPSACRRAVTHHRGVDSFPLTTCQTLSQGLLLFKKKGSRVDDYVMRTSTWTMISKKSLRATPRRSEAAPIWQRQQADVPNKVAGDPTWPLEGREWRIMARLLFSLILHCALRDSKSPKISHGVCQMDLMKLAGCKRGREEDCAASGSSLKSFQSSKSRPAWVHIPDTRTTRRRGDEGGQENADTLTTRETVTDFNCVNLRLGFLLFK